MRVLEHDGDGGVVQLEVGNRLIVGFGKPGNPAQSASSAFEVAYSERGVQVFLHEFVGERKVLRKLILELRAEAQPTPPEIEEFFQMLDEVFGKVKPAS